MNTHKLIHPLIDYIYLYIIFCFLTFKATGIIFYNQNYLCFNKIRKEFKKHINFVILKE